jgi:zinc transport system substrate-binding protein
MAVAAVLVLPGCGSYGYDLDGLSVVAGFYPLAWAAEEIGQARTDVVNITPQGAEPHDVELSARGVEGVRAANFVFLLRGFQPALDEAAAGAGNARVVDLLSVASPRRVDGELDPHVWLDPVRFVEVVRAIGDALERPADAERLIARLRALDREYERGLARCERREIVTSHAAFGYLAERYGLEQVPITGLSPEAEPTARELERVVDQVRASGATTVFFEKLVSPRIAETVAREVDADTAVLDPIEGLTAEEGARGEDYVTVMQANLAALRKALGCR